MNIKQSECVVEGGTLRAERSVNGLIFTDGKQRAEVYLIDGKISQVEYFDEDNDLQVILHDDAHAIVVGEDNWTRDVYHFLKPGGPAPTMRLGITVHQGCGTWSSLPHGFEENVETGFEEIFFYVLEGGSQTALQRGKGMLFDGTMVDEVRLVQDGDFSIVPMGYHPVVGEPGVHVSYVWCYLAKKVEWEKI